MKNLYILQEKINTKEIEDETADYIAFDYIAHNFLLTKKIPHSVIDDHIDDEERENIFKRCSEYLKKLEQLDDTGINFHDVDLVSIVDRNELHEFLMDILPKIKIVTKLLEDNIYKKIFVSSEIHEIFSNTKFASKLEKLNHVEKTNLTFENIQIPLKLGNQEIKFSINRKKYKTLKANVEKISGTLFNLKNNMKEKNKIVLLEFDPEIYFELLKEISSRDLQPVLINFRKSSTHSISAIKNLKKSNSLVITSENFLEKNELESITQTKMSIKNFLAEILENKQPFQNLISKETNFDLLLQRKIINIILQRLDEYLYQILIAEKIKNLDCIKGIITLNFSGETEKIFSKIRNKTPIILLQHAFANYLEPLSYFDILDDYHLIQNKIAVWGDIVKNYLIKIRKIPEDKIIISGSPKYDSFKPITKKSGKKKIILVTLRPIISHAEGIKIELYKRYETAINSIIESCDDLSDNEIIFKLHPQQNYNNQFLKDVIKQKNAGAKIIQSASIKKLLVDCDLHINLAPDNFDISSVVLEAMILKRPTLNIQLQSTPFEFGIIKENAIRTIMYDSDIKQEISELIFNEEKINQLLKKSAVYLTKYISNQGNASKILLDEIIRN